MHMYMQIYIHHLQILYIHTPADVQMHMHLFTNTHILCLYTQSQKGKTHFLQNDLAISKARNPQ